MFYNRVCVGIDWGAPLQSFNNGRPVRHCQVLFVFKWSKEFDEAYKDRSGNIRVYMGLGWEPSAALQ